MKARALTFAAALALGVVADAAWAGGVIIDGRGVGGMTTMMVSNDSDRDSDTNDQPPADDNATAQQLYLWMAMVFSAADPIEVGYWRPIDAPGVDQSRIDLQPIAIVDGIEVDGAGGCQAAPSSTLAGLAALLVWRRRRR